MKYAEEINHVHHSSTPEFWPQAQVLSQYIYINSRGVVVSPHTPPNQLSTVSVSVTARNPNPQQHHQLKYAPYALLQPPYSRYCLHYDVTLLRGSHPHPRARRGSRTRCGGLRHCLRRLEARRINVHTHEMASKVLRSVLSTILCLWL